MTTTSHNPSPTQTNADADGGKGLLQGPVRKIAAGVVGLVLLSNIFGGDDSGSSGSTSYRESGSWQSPASDDFLYPPTNVGQDLGGNGFVVGGTYIEPPD